MPSAVYDKGCEAILDGTVNLEADTIKAVLLDLDDYGVAITAASNASPISITAAGHGLSTGNRVMIARVGGNTNANGVWVVTVVDANTFTLDGSSGNAAYTSGGRVIKLGADSFLLDIPAAARVATSAALASKTFTAGVFDAADTVFTAASGDPSEGVAIFEDTGAAGTSRLLSISDRKADGTAFSVIPNGGDINLQFSASGIFTVRTPVGQAA